MNNPSPGEKDLITIEEAAKHYGFYPDRFRKYLKANECISFVIPYYGNRKLILRRAFEDYLAAYPEFKKEMMKNDAPRKRKNKA